MNPTVRGQSPVAGLWGSRRDTSDFIQILKTSIHCDTRFMQLFQNCRRCWTVFYMQVHQFQVCDETWNWRTCMSNTTHDNDKCYNVRVDTTKERK